MFSVMTPGKIPKTEPTLISTNGCQPADVPDSTKPIEPNTAQYPPYPASFNQANTAFPPVFPPANINVPPPPVNHVVPPMHMNVGRPLRPGGAPPGQPPFHPPYSFPPNSTYFPGGASMPPSNPARAYYPPAP